MRDVTHFTPQNLNKLAELVRGEMPTLSRRVIGALITIDVHARDIVTAMVTDEVCIYHASTTWVLSYNSAAVCV